MVQLRIMSFRDIYLCLFYINTDIYHFRCKTLNSQPLRFLHIILKCTVSTRSHYHQTRNFPKFTSKFNAMHKLSTKSSFVEFDLLIMLLPNIVFFLFSEMICFNVLYGFLSKTRSALKIMQRNSCSDICFPVKDAAVLAMKL